MVQHLQCRDHTRDPCISLAAGRSRVPPGWGGVTLVISEEGWSDLPALRRAELQQIEGHCKKCQSNLQSGGILSSSGFEKPCHRYQTCISMGFLTSCCRTFLSSSSFHFFHSFSPPQAGRLLIPNFFFFNIFLFFLFPTYAACSLHPFPSRWKKNTAEVVRFRGMELHSKSLLRDSWGPGVCGRQEECCCVPRVEQAARWHFRRAFWGWWSVSAEGIKMGQVFKLLLGD